jgi:hypothetical protein
MDCYRPQVCTQRLHKTRADIFFTHSCTDLYEARAILLGRLGRHDQALETYVYRLQNYAKAEECVDFFDIPQSILIPLQDTANVFIGQGQGQVVSSWRYLSSIFDQPCRPVQIYSNRHLNSLVDTAHVWTLWRPYNYSPPL